jgi:tRNA pseudouridine-54 N-methylase
MKEKLYLQKKLKEFRQVEKHLVSREATVVEQPKGKLRAGEHWAEVHAKSSEEELPGLVRRGKFCEQVIQEVKKVRYLCLDGGRAMAEIKSELPDLAVWNVLETLSQEDKETFAHPGRWGPAVGYAKLILGKNYGRSTHTVTNWLKAYRKHRKT